MRSGYRPVLKSFLTVFKKKSIKCISGALNSDVAVLKREIRHSTVIGFFIFKSKLVLYYSLNDIKRAPKKTSCYLMKLSETLKMLCLSVDELSCHCGLVKLRE